MRGCEQIPWLYDAMMVVMEPFGLSRWRRKLARAARGRTLEVGCGTGRNLALYPDEARLVGIDLRLDLLCSARKKDARAHLVVASAEALPFRDDVFETAVSSLVFCSVPDPRRGLREIARVLREEGRLHMLEHVRHRHRLLGRVQDFIQPPWTKITGGCYPNRNTEETVEASGWVIEEETRRAQGVMRFFTAHPPKPPKIPTAVHGGS